MITASPEYWGCPECGGGEFWLLVTGELMCADYPGCGAVVGTWASDRIGAEPDRIAAEAGEPQPALPVCPRCSGQNPDACLCLEDCGYPAVCGARGVKP